ncbi:MAG: hypothetical protein V4692_08215, partial [Bdellovibrionota bacterium]
LPALIEGKNLTNIMQDLGLPFVNVLGSRNDLYLDPLDRQLDLLTLDAFRWYAHVDDSPADRARQRVALTDFYVRASNPDSSVSQMFQATRLDPNTTREKVFQSLLIAKDLITAREAAEAAQRSTTNSLVESVRNGVRSVVRSCNLYLQSRSAAR